MMGPIYASVSPIPTSIQAKMRQTTWRPGCPVALKDLRYIQLNYWGFDNKMHQGVLIVNRRLSKDVVIIFGKLFRAHFPIQRMEPMYRYHGNDEKAMEANNTSGFNCRTVTGTKNTYSQHSYGRAIDINTRINPYVKDGNVQPKNARAFLNRDKQDKGMITKNSQLYRIFHTYGWDWGGDWHALKDYQHFEQR